MRERVAVTFLSFETSCLLAVGSHDIHSFSVGVLLFWDRVGAYYRDKHCLRCTLCFLDLSSTDAMTLAVEASM